MLQLHRLVLGLFGVGRKRLIALVRGPHPVPPFRTPVPQQETQYAPVPMRRSAGEREREGGVKTEAVPIGLRASESPFPLLYIYTIQPGRDVEREHAARFSSSADVDV